MPRSDASILRQRQVRMYRAACRPIIRLHAFSLALLTLAASAAVLFSYILMLVLEGQPVSYGTSLQLCMESALAYAWLVNGSLLTVLVSLAIVTLALVAPRVEASVSRTTTAFGWWRTLQRRNSVTWTWRLLVAASFFAAAVGATLLLLQSHIYAAVPVLAYTGSTCIGIGLIFKRGRHRRCDHCAYPMNSWRGSADLCPECGSPWKRLGGTIYGRRLHRAWLLSGVALLLAAAAIWAFVPL